VASAFYSRCYTLCDCPALLAKLLLHSISGNRGVGTTRDIKGSRVGRRRDKGDLMGDLNHLIGPGDFKLVADGVDGVEME
jgi:hypothetical protein